jgi:hypothetical protein
MVPRKISPFGPLDGWAKTENIVLNQPTAVWSRFGRLVSKGRIKTMNRKIATTVMFVLLIFPWAAQAQGFGGFFGNWPGSGYGDHGKVSAPEMPNYSTLAAGLCGLAGYLLLRRRYARSK